MDPSQINPDELRKSLRLALDMVMAHRIVRGLSIDRERVTALRDEIETRTIQILEETDVSQMPADWSWQLAAERISQQIALAIISEQKNEPPED